MKMRWLLAFLGVCIALGQPAHAASALMSGNYDALLIAYDAGSGQITGGYNEKRGMHDDFSCIFLLKGKMGNGNIAAVEAIDPPDENNKSQGSPIKGTLKVARNKIILRLDDDPPGCNVEGSDFTGKTDLPPERELTATYPWRQIGMVVKKKARFYDSPTASLPRKAYIVYFDMVGISKSENGRALVDYVSGEKPVNGWLPITDLFPGWKP